MKTAKKALLLTVCALVLVAATVMGTLAYLTSTDKVVNTFTVGKLAIKLDEAPTDEYGKVTNTDRNARVQGNEYKIIPNKAYSKDPIVWVQPDSEASYLFVKVEFPNNGVLTSRISEGIGDDGYPSEIVWTDIFEQIGRGRPGELEGNGWQRLPGTDIFWKAAPAVPADAEEVAYPVFQTIGVNKDATAKQMQELHDQGVNVYAYAVQQDGFANAAEAWNATFGAKQ